jgi:hypothetical protein
MRLLRRFKLRGGAGASDAGAKGLLELPRSASSCRDCLFFFLFAFFLLGLQAAIDS